MSDFKINLMRGQCPSYPMRRLGYVCMLLYLVVIATTLVLCIHHFTRSAVRLSQQWHDVDARTLAFHEHYRQARDVERYSRSLRKQLDQMVTRLERVEQLLGTRVLVGELASGLLSALPPGAAIIRLELSETRRELQFDLAVPVADGKSLDVMKLVSEWNQNGALMRQVTPIQSVVSRREEIAGHAMVVLHFTCGLANGGGQ